MAATLHAATAQRWYFAVEHSRARTGSLAAGKTLPLSRRTFNDTKLTKAMVSLSSIINLFREIESNLRVDKASATYTTFPVVNSCSIKTMRILPIGNLCDFIKLSVLTRTNPIQDAKGRES